MPPCTVAPMRLTLHRTSTASASCVALCVCHLSSGHASASLFLVCVLCSVPGVISKSPSRDIAPIVKDYSDLGIDEDDKWQDKFADFKMKTSVRRRLFHLNHIKTVGFAPVSPSAKSAPLPDVLNAIGHSRTQSHPLNPVTPLAASPFTGPAGMQSHLWSPSFTGSSSGSFGL